MGKKSKKNEDTKGLDQSQDERLISVVTDKVVDLLVPKLDELENRLKSMLQKEVTEIRMMIKPQTEQLSLEKGASKTPSGSSQDFMGMMKAALDDPQIKGLADKFGVQIGQDGQFQQQPTGLAGLVQLINALKQLEGGGGSGIGGASMAQAFERYMFSMMHMQHSLFNQIIKDGLKKHGASDQELTDFDATQDVLFEPINKLGVRTRMKEAELKKVKKDE